MAFLFPADPGADAVRLAGRELMESRPLVTIDRPTRQRGVRDRHRTTCQMMAPGRTIMFTCRAADAMLDNGEARRHSRESFILLRAVSLSRATLRT
jgi:hypothetical protein